MTYAVLFQSNSCPEPLDSLTNESWLNPRQVVILYKLLILELLQIYRTVIKIQCGESLISLHSLLLPYDSTVWNARRSWFVCVLCFVRFRCSNLEQAR